MAWGQQEEEAADKKLRRSRRLKDPVAAGALLAEMLATDTYHTRLILSTAKAARHTTRSTGKSLRSFAETVSYFLGLHVQPGERGRLPLPACLQGFELVEGLVHLAGEVRLVAAYPLQVGLI